MVQRVEEQTGKRQPNRHGLPLSRGSPFLRLDLERNSKFFKLPNNHFEGSAPRMIARIEHELAHPC